MRKRLVVAAVGVAAAAAVTGGGVAVASNSGDDSAESTQYTPEQADAATKAALDATGGGKANKVESDNENGAAYEVEVTKTDGSKVDVRLDADYKVVVIENDTENNDHGDSDHQDEKNDNDHGSEAQGSDSD